MMRICAIICALALARPVAAEPNTIVFMRAPRTSSTAYPPGSVAFSLIRDEGDVHGAWAPDPVWRDLAERERLNRLYRATVEKSTCAEDLESAVEVIDDLSADLEAERRAALAKPDVAWWGWALIGVLAAGTVGGLLYSRLP